MIFKRSNLIQRGVVGINARNLDYIFAKNNRKYYPYADSKLATKALAESVGVQTPALIGELNWQYEIKRLHSILKDHSEFVIKPDHGAGGGGILVITDILPVGYKRSSGVVSSKTDLQFHCQNIISGMFSLGGQRVRLICILAVLEWALTWRAALRPRRCNLINISSAIRKRDTYLAEELFRNGTKCWI